MGAAADARRSGGKKNDKPQPALVALAASCVGELREILAQVENAQKSPSDLDVQVLSVVRGLGLGVLSAMLSHLGASGAGTLRETGADTVLGHVRFVCRYAAPDADAPVSRQDKRRRKREAQKGKRRSKNGDFVRVGGAEGAYPLKTALGLVEGMTPGLAAQHQRVAVLSGAFREGAATLHRLAGVVMSESTFMRRAYAAGQHALLEQELAVMRRVLCGALPAHLIAALTPVVPTLYIMMDGTGVPCVKRDTRRHKGKDGKRAKTREVKVGVVGTFRWADARGRPVRDLGAETHIVSAKTAKAFGALLRRVANSRGYGKDGLRIQICGDGAEWIERIVKQAFPGADIIFVNDFYHACEHLHNFLGHALKGAKALVPAFAKARGILLRTGGQGLITHLERFYASTAADNKEAMKELTYFKKRITHMKYAEYRKARLYIGSGIVEAACRTDVARRCKQAGMHWRLHNAAAMCALTARLRSGVPAAKPAA